MPSTWEMVKYVKFQEPKPHVWASHLTQMKTKKNWEIFLYTLSEKAQALSDTIINVSPSEPLNIIYPQIPYWNPWNREGQDVSLNL